MKSRVTPAFAKIAARYELDAQVLVNDIVASLQRHGIIEEAFYGEPVKDAALTEDTTLEQFCGAVKEAFGDIKLNGDEFFAALELVVLGDGDCPECGCEMEVTEQTTRRYCGNGYDTEEEFDILHETKRCPYCGNIISY